MPNHKDTMKRARQNVVRNARNRHYRTRMRTQIKRLRIALDSGDKTAALAQLPKTVSEIQHVAQKGIIHRKQASRRVSRLARAVNAMDGK